MVLYLLAMGAVVHEGFHNQACVLGVVLNHMVDFEEDIGSSTKVDSSSASYLDVAKGFF
jgi:hypothetical protein